MKTRYKLTHANKITRSDCKWDEGVTNSAPGTGELCTSGWIHVYTDPLLGVFLDPMHGDFGPNALMWRCECWGASKDDYGCKEGWQYVRTVEHIPLPVITTEQRVEIAIRTSLELPQSDAYIAWANRWLDGKDHSQGAVRAAAGAAAQSAAPWSAAAWAVEAGWSAAWSAEAEAEAVEAGREEVKAWSAVVQSAMAEAEAVAARSAALAAQSAPIDLIRIVHEVVGGRDTGPVAAPATV